MKVYIASKMTGLPNYNIEEFDRVAEKLMGLGLEVVSPALIAKEHGTEHNKEFYMRRCVELILSVDAIILFGDWKNSDGAKFECSLARQLNLPIFEAVNL